MMPGKPFRRVAQAYHQRQAEQAAAEFEEG